MQSDIFLREADVHMPQKSIHVQCTEQSHSKTEVWTRILYSQQSYLQQGENDVYKSGLTRIRAHDQSVAVFYRIIWSIGFTFNFLALPTMYVQYYGSECSIHLDLLLKYFITLDRRQSKTLLTTDESRSKIARNSVFYCHLSPIWRQMAIENSVSKDFLSTFMDSINVLTFPTIATYLECSWVHQILKEYRTYFHINIPFFINENCDDLILSIYMLLLRPNKKICVVQITPWKN